MLLANLPSLHARQEREKRYQVIFQQHLENGDTIGVFFWERGHKNGPELHEITESGLINIYNFNSSKLVTTLIARPEQIKRYTSNPQIIPWYEEEEALKDVISVCKLHQKMGLNHI